MIEKMRLAIDADDAAINLKNTILAHLVEKGFNIDDLQYSKGRKANYPEIAYNLAKKIQSGEYDRGILICGTGLGMAIVANKVKGVYAGSCHDVYSAERLAKSNDANVLTMGERVIGPELAKMVVDAWLGSRFDGGRSIPKVQEMRDIENQSFECSK